MGLQPLEFSECLRDSPYFRETLHAHEKELERTSKAIKGLINECKELILAAKSLSKAQRNFSNTLIHFKFETIGCELTDDEIVISESLKEFGKLISGIEDERDRMLERAYEQIIQPLENFRKEQIGGAKEGKKKFDKQTAKFCQSLDRYLSLKNKASDGLLQEADAALEMEGRHFYQASMQYVLLLQEVHERKKFEFVETLLGFMYGWLTFYHQGHEVATDMRPYMQDLQSKLQKCRENFATAHEEAEQLMNKMLEVRGTKPPLDQGRSATKEGYLYVMEKKALGTTWSKYYCQYQKENHILTMIPYNQTTGKGINTDTMLLTSCTRRASDSIDKRFCFDITVQDRSGPLTFQALCEDDRRSWLDAMDGKEPIYNQPSSTSEQKDSQLDDIGFSFIKKCISAIETQGLKDQGLYRVVGVNSKVNKLLSMGLDRRKTDKLNLEDSEWEVKTITSALKNYFRSLPEPLMTFKLNPQFITAAKKESKTLRVNDIHELIFNLPKANFNMLELLIRHLHRVAEHANINLMTVSNLGVCFGPTLMRTQEETIAAIMDIKFCNIVVEILIENYETIFHQVPDGVTDISRLTKTKPALPAGGKPTHVTTKLTNQTASAPASTTTTPTGGGTPPPGAPMHNSAIGLPASQTSSHPLHETSPVKPHHRRKGSTSSLSSIGTPTNNAAANTTHSYNNNPNNNSQTYAQVRAKLRPTQGFYSQFSPAEHPSSTSSSSESLNRVARHGLGSSGGGKTEPTTSSSTSSISSMSSGHKNGGSGRKVRTLYACEAENESEMSFEPNQIIVNVRPSREPGWLEGSLDGKNGLIPANYVEFLN